MATYARQTALFFGSFDPVHIGHLVIAEYFLNQPDVEEVWFVVSPQNPLKTANKLTDEALRREMLALAIEGSSGYQVSDIEFTMPPPHYTYKTLLQLKESHPEKHFVLVIGGDNLQDFHLWKNHLDIIDLLPVYVYPRRSYDSNAWDACSNIIKKDEAPLVEVSSSVIRKNLAQGLSARFMLNEKVYRFIRENKLYERPNASLSLST